MYFLLPHTQLQHISMQAGQMQPDALLFTFNSQQLLPPPRQLPRPAPKPIPPLRQFRSKKLKHPHPSLVTHNEQSQRPIDKAINKFLAAPQHFHHLPILRQQVPNDSFSLCSKQLPPHNQSILPPKQPQSMQELGTPGEYVDNDRKQLTQSREKRRRTVSLRETPKVDFNQKKLPRAFRLKSMSQDKQRPRKNEGMVRQCLTQESGGMRKKSRYLMMGEVNNEESPRFNLP